MKNVTNESSTRVIGKNNEVKDGLIMIVRCSGKEVENNTKMFVQTFFIEITKFFC